MTVAIKVLGYMNSMKMGDNVPKTQKENHIKYI